MLERIDGFIDGCVFFVNEYGSSRDSKCAKGVHSAQDPPLNRGGISHERPLKGGTLGVFEDVLCVESE